MNTFVFHLLLDLRKPGVSGALHTFLEAINQQTALAAIQQAEDWGKETDTAPLSKVYVLLHTSKNPVILFLSFAPWSLVWIEYPNKTKEGPDKVWEWYLSILQLLLTLDAHTRFATRDQQPDSVPFESLRQAIEDHLAPSSSSKTSYDHHMSGIKDFLEAGSIKQALDHLQALLDMLAFADLSDTLLMVTGMYHTNEDHYFLKGLISYETYLRQLRMIQNNILQLLGHVQERIE